MKVKHRVVARYQPIRTTPVLWLQSAILPSIAQLVERWTVVVNCQISIGRWFKSGSKEFLFSKKIVEKIVLHLDSYKNFNTIKIIVQ